MDVIVNARKRFREFMVMLILSFSRIRYASYLRDREEGQGRGGLIER